MKSKFFISLLLCALSAPLFGDQFVSIERIRQCSAAYACRGVLNQVDKIRHQTQVAAPMTSGCTGGIADLVDVNHLILIAAMGIFGPDIPGVDNEFAFVKDPFDLPVCADNVDFAHGTCRIGGHVVGGNRPVGKTNHDTLTVHLVVIAFPDAP